MSSNSLTWAAALNMNIEQLRAHLDCHRIQHPGPPYLDGKDVAGKIDWIFAAMKYSRLMPQGHQRHIPPSPSAPPPPTGYELTPTVKPLEKMYYPVVAEPEIIAPPRAATPMPTRRAWNPFFPAISPISAAQPLPQQKVVESPPPAVESATEPSAQETIPLEQRLADLMATPKVTAASIIREPEIPALVPPPARAVSEPKPVEKPAPPQSLAPPTQVSVEPVPEPSRVMAEDVEMAPPAPAPKTEFVMEGFVPHRQRRNDPGLFLPFTLANTIKKTA